MSLTAPLGETAPQQPETMLGAVDSTNHLSPQTEDFFIPSGNLYLPENGEFRPDRQKPLPAGNLIIGTYITARAMHPTGIYLPSGYKPTENNPIVVKKSALGTGVKGLNDMFSREILDTGCVVLSMGPPRYYGPILHALTQTEDANEMHGLVSAVEKAGIVGSAEEVWVDGQSQSAMKALGFMAVARFYSRRVVDGHVVAVCFLDEANVRNPYKFIRYGTSMLQSIGRAAKNISFEEALQLRGTVSRKDLHHHAAVIPNLLSGETGTFLPNIDSDQEATVDLFGKDRSSRAHRTAPRLRSLFPNMDIDLNENYGHCDGIMSPETKARRHAVFTKAAANRDSRPVLRVVS